MIDYVYLTSTWFYNKDEWQDWLELGVVPNQFDPGHRYRKEPKQKKNSIPNSRKLPPNKLPADLVAGIMGDWISGMTARGIGVKYNKPKSTIESIIERYKDKGEKIVRQKRINGSGWKYSYEFKEQIYNEFQAGATSISLAKKYNKTKPAIDSIIYKHKKTKK